MHYDDDDYCEFKRYCDIDHQLPNCSIEIRSLRVCLFMYQLKHHVKLKQAYFVSHLWQKGYCDLDATLQRLLLIDVGKCQKLMISSGLNSFGKSAPYKQQQDALSWVCARAHTCTHTHTRMKTTTTATITQKQTDHTGTQTHTHTHESHH